MLNYWLIWANHHRMPLIGGIGVLLWATAYCWYFSVDLERFRTRRKPRKWSADQMTKTGKGGYDKQR